MFLGIALKVAATFAFAAMSALIKTASPRFPVGEVVLFRSLFALAVLVAWLAWRGEFPHALHTQAKARPYRALDRRIGRHVRQFHRAVAVAARRRHRLHLRHAADRGSPGGADAGRNRALLSLGGGGARLRRRHRHAVRPSRRGLQQFGGGGALLDGRHDRPRRSLELGGGDDPDPSTDAIGADRRDRLLFLLADGCGQRGAAHGRRAVAGGGARRRLHGGAAIRGALARRIRSARFDRRARGNRADPDDAQLPLRRRLDHRRFRLCRDDLGRGAGLCVLCRDAVAADSVRRGDRRGRRRLRPVARAFGAAHPPGRRAGEAGRDV